MPTPTRTIRLDENNRLIITDESSRTVKYPETNSTAAYSTAIDTSGREKALKRLAVSGKWFLTETHDLELRVSGSDSRYAGKNIILRGDIVSVTDTKLGFRVRECDTLTGLRTTTIELNGIWKADSKNRVTFRAAKHTGRTDTLTFEGAWQVNGKNEIEYRYIKTDLKKKTKKEHTVIFKGAWDIGNKALVYHVENSSLSKFKFKAALKTKRLNAKDKSIQYEIGIEYTKRGTVEKVARRIAIYGKWDLAKNLKVLFKAGTTQKRGQAIEFGIEKQTNETSAVALTLRKESGLPLGLVLTLTKSFGPDKELFLSMNHSPAETRVEGGVTIRF